MRIKTETTDWSIVRETIQQGNLVSLNLKWSWADFNWVYEYSFEIKQYPLASFLENHYRQQVKIARRAEQEYQMKMLGNPSFEEMRAAQQNTKPLYNPRDLANNRAKSLES